MDNVGLKRHNGGAGVVRCSHTETTYENQFTYLSGKARTAHYTEVIDEETNTVSTRLSHLDDPSTSKVEIKDQYDDSKTFTLLKYGTMISNNTFSGNSSGKRGTALLIELVNEL